MVPPAIIETPRLTLIMLTDTSEGSQHVQWFYEDWSDPDATAWSPSGPRKTIAASREWMIEHRTKWDNYFYAVFTKDSDHKPTESSPGTHIGSVSLRLQLDGPAVQPPDPPRTEDKGKPVNLRAMGYALFKKYWGQGYATEANQALLDAYAASVQGEKAKGEVFYIEAGVDNGNPGSQKVLKKLGFKPVGWKAEPEPVFLAGEWRNDGGYNILGQYI